MVKYKQSDLLQSEKILYLFKTSFYICGISSLFLIMNSFSTEIGYSVRTILVMQHIIHFVHVLLVCVLRYIFLS
jgi:hypothetical protein